jgi:hypothetical protein
MLVLLSLYFNNACILPPLPDLFDLFSHLEVPVSCPRPYLFYSITSTEFGEANQCPSYYVYIQTYFNYLLSMSLAVPPGLLTLINTRFLINNIYKFRSYLTEHTLCIPYEDRTVNAI